MADWVDFARHIITKLDAEVSNTESYVGGGGCASYDDYRYQVGRLNAFREAQELIRSLLKNVEVDDE